MFFTSTAFVEWEIAAFEKQYEFLTELGKGQNGEKRRRVHLSTTVKQIESGEIPIQGNTAVGESCGRAQN